MKNNRIYTILFTGALPFLLVSCFAAKEYEKPQVVEEANYRTDEIPTDSLTMATISWREIFEDDVLQGHVETALQNNIDIRVAIQQIMAAEAYLKQGKAGYFPTLGVNAQWTHQENSENSQLGSFLSNSSDQYQLAANLSWEADIWGKIRSQKRAFGANYLQSVAAHKAVKTRLIANVASIYYQLLAIDEQIKVTEETISNRQNSLETTKALKEAGNVTEVGVQQTEAQLYTAQAILVDLQKQTRLLENSLSILLGEAPMFIPRTELEEQKIMLDLNTGVPAQLLSNRPDVMAAEYAYRNAFEMTNVVRSNFYPSLTISASGGFQSLELDNLLNANSLFANIVSGIAQPIFNKRQIRTQFEVAQAQQEQARLRFRESILQASKEVSDAMYSYKAASQKIDLKEKEYQAYKNATDYSEELLNNGLANYLEVLTARENALNSQLGVIDAKYNRLNSMVDLYRALGGGWQ
ncbi:efflux transporter outer membrane subunit [Haloflavibacter putidus]|uniref:Efflux transporter outer membrane subunit n=1 Tax=Haloflavibacter putidus TaxID=2576776 RepID=A0A507ZRY9_9FLAO|nr:efflux transporter outer membrane subunit [Haloflavibacter putidus]TQD40566.1 efflux transporter outer membrane subunit [Haloflavibacter putidus]